MGLWQCVPVAEQPLLVFFFEKVVTVSERVEVATVDVDGDVWHTLPFDPLSVKSADGCLRTFMVEDGDEVIPCGIAEGIGV